MFVNFLPNNAFALGKVELESSSFMRSSDDRGNLSSTIILNPQIEARGSYLTEKIDLKTLAFISEFSKSVTIEFHDAYISSLSASTGEPGGFQLTLGRRKFDWSVADDRWSLGYWSPRFVWESLRPEQVGKTGLFVGYEGGGIRLLAHGSPIAIPERGFPIRTSYGRTLSASPFYIQPPELIRIGERLHPLRYSIEYPSSARDLFLRPNASFMARLERKGAWAGFGYSYSPIAKAQLAIEPRVQLDDTVAIDAGVHPYFPYHHLLTAEAGFDAPAASVWISVTREIAEAENLPSSWIASQPENAVISVLGAEIQATKNVSFHPSFLAAWEKSGAASLQSNDPSLSRLQFKRALSLKASWEANDAFEYAVSTLYDFEYRSGLYSFDVSFLGTRGASGWNVGAGLDFFSSASREGSLGQYFGDDRLRWKVSHAF